MDYMQGSLFENVNKAPLADRVRPRTFEEYIGQEHILGKGKVLRQLVESDNITSMILWGPPGVGKTTLAMIIANMTNADFITFSAVTTGIKEIKEIMSKAEFSKMMGTRTVIFVDEIHRFNKAQQDAFLPHVEKGNIVLIGATTENPSFEINSALLSRSRVFVLKSLQKEDIIKLLKNVIKDERGYGNGSIDISDELLSLIAAYSNGDARTALNVLEMAVMSGEIKGRTTVISKEIVEGCIQKKALLYDKNGEEHYNLISALHKSMRNSDPDAAVYWLARMLEAGEEPLYIARRLIRFASEDIGLSDPRALYMAYEKAKTDAQNTIAEGVPLHLRNAPTKLMENLDYGKGYQYAHDSKDKVANMQCLPENMKDRQYYQPTNQGVEKNIKERLESIKNLKTKTKNTQ